MPPKVVCENGYISTIRGLPRVTISDVQERVDTEEYVMKRSGKVKLLVSYIIYFHQGWATKIHY